MTRCPACDSPDLVSYWSKRVASRAWDVLIAAFYPDAERCVDCRRVWIHGAKRETEMREQFRKMLASGSYRVITTMPVMNATFTIPDDNPAPGVQDGEASDLSGR